MPVEGLQLGRYRLLEQIGIGGMCEVYHAENIDIHQQVAIKIIRTEVTPFIESNTLKKAVRLFKREAEATGMLDHPHIVPLYYFGEDVVNGIIRSYLVMPFYPARSLADWLKQRTRTAALSLGDVAVIIHQAADALQHAHDHQIIHQDVKPSNFLVRNNKNNPGRPDIVLADFGVAMIMDVATQMSRNIRGTVEYMAPEQWNGQPVYATDQYALAITAYELLTGRPPFQGNLAQLMYQHLNIPYESVSRLCMLQPRIPARLAERLDLVLARALRKNPADRYPSIAAFARDFEEALRHERPRGKDLCITLLISEKEARLGTQRTLTLPHGRQMNVAVPGGAYEGQVIHLEGRGEPSPFGGPAGALILTIAIAASPRVVHSPSQAVWRRLVTWVRKAITNLEARSSEKWKTRLENVSAPTRGSMPPGALVAKRRITRRNMLIGLGLAAGLTATGIGISRLKDLFPVPPPPPTPTPDPYTQILTRATQGPPTINDPLNAPDNYRWSQYQNQTGGCDFNKDGTYHSREQATYFGNCYASETDFTDFAYQVEVTIISGTTAGIWFRSPFSQNYDAYYFYIHTDGRYDFIKRTLNAQQTYDAASLTGGFSPAIHRGLNQPNLVTVVARGNTFYCYVNQRYVATATDDSYKSGSIGVGANLGADMGGEASFRNLKVWQL